MVWPVDCWHVVHWLVPCQITLEAVWSARWAAFAVGFVFLYMMFHTTSVFLAIFGMVQILMAFPIVYYVYYTHFEVHSMGIVNIMSLFVLCGIGTDDVFILVDTFLKVPRRRHNKHGHPIPRHVDRLNRLVHAYKHAGSAMFVTSVTTAASFYSNVRPRRT